MWGVDLCRTEFLSDTLALWAAVNLQCTDGRERGLNGVIYSSMKETGDRATGKPKQAVKPDSNPSKNKIERSSGEALLIHKQLVVLKSGTKECCRPSSTEIGMQCGRKTFSPA